MSDEHTERGEDTTERGPARRGGGPPWYRTRGARAGWFLLRSAVLGMGTLVVARWMGAVWDHGWFKAVTAALLCLGAPTGFMLLIRRQTRRLGGAPRFAWLTIVALLNLPVLVWVGVRSPSTALDALRHEGLDAVRWVKRNTGHRAPDEGADAAEEERVAPGQAPPAEDDGGAVREPAAEPGADDADRADTGAPPGRDVPVVGAEPTRGQAIPFESASGQMIVNASINGGDPLPFTLDTGATLSTLDRATLDRLGLAVPPDAPVRTLQTAGGPLEGPLVLVDAVTVGDHRREGVGFWICEACAGHGTVGLLGLNVWQGYLLTIDPVEQSIWLEPRDGSSSRTVDIEPYLGVNATSSRVADGQLIVDLALDNRSPRDIEQATILVRALDARDREVGAFTIEAGAIPARGQSRASGEMPQAGEVAQVKLELLDAWW